MNDRQVGTLVVVDETSRPIGIVTDRDLTVRVLARGRDPGVTSVGNVMTRQPRSVEENASIESALAAMRINASRRITVVDNTGRLVGLISLDDVLALLAEEFGQIGDVIEQESPKSLASA